MLLCMNQLVNHLDKLPLFGWKPRVIIRTRVGSKIPLNAGPQHTQNHTEALRKMLTSVVVLECTTVEEVKYAYNRARWSEQSMLIIENPGEGY